MSPEIDRRETIVAVISSLGAGGAEKVLAWLAHAWIDAGFRVTIVAFDRPAGPIYHDFPEAAQIVRLACQRGGIRSMLRRMIRLRRVIRREQPSTVVSFLTKINILTLLATIGLPARIAVSERNNPEKQKKNALWNVMLAWAYRRASLIVCQTEAVIRCIPRPLRGRVVVIPNPIEPSQFRPALHSRRIVAVGRLTEQKGFDLLIAAFQRVWARHPDWVLEIWGEGPDRAALEAQISALGLADCVLLPGITPKPRLWIERASLFVLPSRFEGFSNVLGEAMAAGLPVVSFDCDFGPSALVRDGVNGILVPVEDSARLAEAIERLIEDPRLRERMGEAAKLVGKRFSVGAIIREWDRGLGLTREPSGQQRGTAVPVQFANGRSSPSFAGADRRRHESPAQPKVRPSEPVQIIPTSPRRHSAG